MSLAELAQFGIGHLSPGALRDAINECPHGRLPLDRTPGCGCWPQEVLTHPTFTTEEPIVSIDTTEAPFGYKADGTPRKRRAPAPEQVARMRAARTPKAVTVVASPAPSSSPLLTQMLATIDVEIARLTRARRALAEAAA